MNKTFYITTTLPYVNSEPHIGFALEIVLADVLARYHASLGEEIFFNTGTDEHGLKLYQKAVEAGQTPKEYVDYFAEIFKSLVPKLGIVQDVHFIRTTDEHHIEAAQEFWRKCLANGDIYKSRYQVKYCVGCELEKTDSELVEGECSLHPGKEVELIDEENYFFRFSKFEKPLLQLYQKYPDFVLPDHRLTEIRKFVEAGLKDFSVSRVKDKMPWGIPVPDDTEQVMYVWFDALVNYISTLGWPVYQSQTPVHGTVTSLTPVHGTVTSLTPVQGTATSLTPVQGTATSQSTVQGTATSQAPEGEPVEAKSETPNSKSQIHSNTQILNFEKFWGNLDEPKAIQVAGKDNLRQQSAMWQAMLLSAGLPPTRRILIHGFITSNGQKMSKTVGNVVSPFEIMDALVEKGVAKEQAIDALRYYLCVEIPTFEDGDFTWEKFWESYNANLANGLGNLVSRVLKMAANAQLTAYSLQLTAFDAQFAEYLEKYEIQKAGEWVWTKIKEADEYIAKEEPFKVIKVDPEKGKKQIEHLLLELENIAFHLQPFLPNTAGKILGALKNLENLEPLRLFPRV